MAARETSSGFSQRGSIFKNLPGQPAGKLVEETGLKA